MLLRLYRFKTGCGLREPDLAWQAVPGSTAWAPTGLREAPHVSDYPSRAQDVGNVGQKRGVSSLMPRHSLQQLKCARHRERQDEPVRLRRGQGAFGGDGGSALVAEFAALDGRQVPQRVSRSRWPEHSRAP